MSHRRGQSTPRNEVWPHQGPRRGLRVRRARWRRGRIAAVPVRRDADVCAAHAAGDQPRRRRPVQPQVDRRDGLQAQAGDDWPADLYHSANLRRGRHRRRQHQGHASGRDLSLSVCRALGARPHQHVARLHAGRRGPGERPRQQKGGRGRAHRDGGRDGRAGARGGRSLVQAAQGDCGRPQDGDAGGAAVTIWATVQTQEEQAHAQARVAKK